MVIEPRNMSTEKKLPDMSRDSRFGPKEVRWTPKIRTWHTQAIVTATAVKATPLVLQSIEPDIVTYASDLTVPTARLLSAFLLW